DVLEMAALLRLRAVRDQDRAAHGQTGQVDQQRRLRARHLLLEDDLLDERGAAPAVVRRPGDAAPAGFPETSLPRLAVGDPLVEPLGLGPRRVGVEPAAQLRPEALLLGAVREVHCGKYSGSASCQNQASGGDSSLDSTVVSILRSAVSLFTLSRACASSS